MAAIWPSCMEGELFCLRPTNFIQRVLPLSHRFQLRTNLSYHAAMIIYADRTEWSCQFQRYSNSPSIHWHDGQNGPHAHSATQMSKRDWTWFPLIKSLDQTFKISNLKSIYYSFSFQVKIRVTQSRSTPVWQQWCTAQWDIGLQQWQTEFKGLSVVSSTSKVHFSVFLRAVKGELHPN